MLSLLINLDPYGEIDYFIPPCLPTEGHTGHLVSAQYSTCTINEAGYSQFSMTIIFRLGQENNHNFILQHFSPEVVKFPLNFCAYDVLTDINSFYSCHWDHHSL